MSLFEAGTHRGNKKSRLNPKLKTKIYGVSGGISLINLAETKNSIEIASELMYKLGQKKKQILVVGTSKHIKEFTPELSRLFSGPEMPYINNRWLGGTLTNWSTIKKTLKSLEKLENIESNKEFFGRLARNEQLNVVRKKEKINRFFAGLVNLKSNKPGAILVLDAANNPIAIQEADCMNIPVITLTNTNTLTLPENLNYTVVCNVNSINTIKLITSTLIESYNDGLVTGIPQPTEVKTNETVTVTA